jgi:hypothetical protein
VNSKSDVVRTAFCTARGNSGNRACVVFTTGWDTPVNSDGIDFGSEVEIEPALSLVARTPKKL